LAALMTACGVFQEVEEASGTIEAIPLELETASPTEAATEPEPVEDPTDPPPTAVPDEGSAYPAPDESESEDETNDEIEAYPAPEEPTGETSEETEAYPAPEVGEAQTGETRIYQIDQSGSSVRFELDEDLRGQRTTVVGVTDQVAGEIAVNLSDLSTAQVGVIQINARTLTTDNNFRNRAINNEILDTGEYEFITFTPTGVDGLPATITIGEEVSFKLSGELTIRDITQPVVFDVSATAVSETQLTGTARAVVLRSDYDLQIPTVPGVANVEDEVELYIDFVANSVRL
jgi:polyisoprenoid-binding protein YceI